MFGSVINYRVCELCYQTTREVATESRFNSNFSCFAKIWESIWTNMIHWFEWECLLAMLALHWVNYSLMCLASPASGPPWPHLCPELNSDDGHCGVWTLDHRDGSSCQNVYQGSGLLTFQLKLNIIQSKTNTRIPILDRQLSLITW